MDQHGIIIADMLQRKNNKNMSDILSYRKDEKLKKELSNVKLENDQLKKKISNLEIMLEEYRYKN